MLDQLFSSSWSLTTPVTQHHTTAGHHEITMMALDKQWLAKAAVSDGQRIDGDQTAFLGGQTVGQSADDPAALLENSVATGLPGGLLAGQIGLSGGQNSLSGGQIAFLLYLSLVFLVAVSLNLSLLLVFMRKPSLRTTSNRYLF